MYFLSLIFLCVNNGLKLDKSSFHISLEIDKLFEVDHNPVCVEFVIFLSEIVVGH